MPTTERENPKAEVVMDVTAERIARVYAQAFIGVAAKSPDAETLVEEVAALAGLLASLPRLEEIFHTALISPEQKERMLDRVLAGRVSPATLNFLKVLSKHGRLGLLRDIARLVKKLDAQRRGLTDVEVRVARELADDIRSEIYDRLRKALGTEPVLHVKVDESLIAGIWVRVGDRVYDGSIRTQLEQTRRAMIERATQMIETQPQRFLTA
jgi:F-type H+-transporting ATPase subunit delta